MTERRETVRPLLLRRCLCREERGEREREREGKWMMGNERRDKGKKILFLDFDLFVAENF
jgi:hypothetical protein